MMDKIRVLHLTKSEGFYGIERVILNLIENINSERFDTCLGNLMNDRYSHSELLEEVAKRGRKTFAIRCIKRIDIRSLRQLLSVLRKNEIDIVHCHEMKSRLYGLVASRALKLPIITTNHNWGKANRLVTTFGYLDLFYMRFFDRIIAVSKELRQRMLNFGIPTKKISVIINGIDMREFKKTRNSAFGLKKSLGIRKGMRIVGSVGRLSKEKGYKYLLEAATKVLREIPDVCFLIVGDGPLRAELAQYAKALGIYDRVVFTGFRKDIKDFYSLMDVYALTSSMEGMPMAMMEAMATGVPVVAVNVGGISNIIRHNENGILLNSNDPGKLSESILYLLTNHIESAGIAANAKITIRQDHSAEKMAKQYEDMYTDILGQ